MLDPRLSPQEQPFLFHEPNKDDDRESSWDSMNRAFRAQTYQSPGSPRRTHYRSLSPAARAQAIANGQRELMEMVSNMPESCYELSLKDLVEHNRRRDNHDEARADASSELGLLERRSSFGPDDIAVAAQRAAARPKAAAVTSSSVGSGHLLKMGFPVSFGPRSRLKKVASTKKKTAPAAPEDSNSKVPANSGGVVDKEWWKKRYGGGCGNGGGGGVESYQSDGDLSSSGAHGSRKSTATTTSSSSGSRSSSLSSQSSTRTSRNQRRVTGGCWGFINRKKNRDVES